MLNPVTKVAPKKKKNVWEVDLPMGISAVSFLEVLRFVYCGMRIKKLYSLFAGKIGLEEMKDPEILYILFAVNQFEGNVPLLAYQCETRVTKNVDIGNVHNTLKLASDLRLQYVKDFCIHFAVSKYDSFIG